MVTIKHIIILLILSSCYNKGIDYNPKPNARQKKYNEKHPIQKKIPTYFEGCSNIKIRRFIINGCIYKGELNGKGRPILTHSYKDCPNCRRSLKQDVLEVLQTNKPKRSFLYHKIDSLLRYDVYKGKERKERTTLEILKLIE